MGRIFEKRKRHERHKSRQSLPKVAATVLCLQEAMFQGQKKPMIRVFRDRSIIAACLVLYALGMMMASLSHSYAHQMDANTQSDVISYGVVCSVDGDAHGVEPHCPFCRLTDAAVTITPTDFTPHIVFAYTEFQRSEKHIIQTLDPKRSPPKRGPPLSV